MKNIINFIKWDDLRLKLYLNYFKYDLIDKILNLLNEKDKNILDLYCKTGLATIKIAKERTHSHVIGMENHYQLLRIAKRRKRHNIVKNVDFMNLSNLESYHEPFDSILLFFVLSDLTHDNIMSILIRLKERLMNECKVIIVDYANTSSKILLFIRKILMSRKRKRFIKLNLEEMLSNMGYTNICVEDLQGIKLISTTTNIK